MAVDNYKNNKLLMNIQRDIESIILPSDSADFVPQDSSGPVVWRGIVSV